MALFNILVDIAAKTASFESGMQRVEKRLESFGANTRKLAQTAGGLLGVTLGFDAVRQSVDRAIARGDELVRLGERMDTTAKSLSQLEYAAKKSDMEFASLAGNVDTFTKNVGMAAAGTGKAQKALRELGINAKQLAALGLDEQLDLIADAISRISNPTRRQTLTSQLFGDANMLSILKDGSEGLRKLREESDRLGFSLENEAAEKLAMADDAMKALNVSSTALASTFAVYLAPAITQVLNGINAFATGDFTKNLRAQMADLTERRNELLEQQRNIKTSWLSKFLLGDNVDGALASVAKNIASVEAQMNRINDLMLKGDAAASAGAGKSADPTAGWVDLSAIDRRLETMRVLAENIAEFEQIDKRLQESLASSRERQADLMKVVNDGIEDGVTETNRRAAESLEQLHDRIGEVINGTNEMTEFARQAAANMQTYFAEFLFDPFKDGLRGMVTGFLDTIRRMLAEAAAAKLLETLFGKSSSKDGGFFGTILGAVAGSFGGGKAKGGPLQQGKWYVAGEHGPEPIWGGGAGAYATGYGGGGNVSVSPQYNIDARGASTDLVRALPGILKQNNESLKTDIIVGLQRRKYRV